MLPSPALSIGPCGAGLPLAPWALLLCWGSPVPETHSPRVLLGGEAGLGARRPSGPTPQPCPLSHLGRSSPRPRRTDGPKQASGSCIVQRENLLGQPTTAPTRLGSGKQQGPGSQGQPRPALPSGERRAGAKTACVAFLSRGALGLLLAARGDFPFVQFSYCAQAASMPPEPARPLSALAPSHRRPKTSFW